jgi:hypothetical protein
LTARCKSAERRAHQPAEDARGRHAVVGENEVHQLELHQHHDGALEQDDGDQRQPTDEGDLVHRAQAQAFEPAHDRAAGCALPAEVVQDRDVEEDHADTQHLEQAAQQQQPGQRNGTPALPGRDQRDDLANDGDFTRQHAHGSADARRDWPAAQKILRLP